MKEKTQLILLSALVSAFTSCMTFGLLMVVTDAASSVGSAPVLTPRKVSISFSPVSPGDSADGNKYIGQYNTWDDGTCDKYWHNSTSGKCALNYALGLNIAEWQGKNYTALCDTANGEVMVGFRWGASWGNRYVIVPRCAKLSLTWINT